MTLIILDSLDKSFGFERLFWSTENNLLSLNDSYIGYYVLMICRETRVTNYSIVLEP